MGEKKMLNGAVGGLLSAAAVKALSPLAEPVVNAVINYADKAIEDQKNLIPVPELYSKRFRLKAEQAIEVLDGCGLKATVIYTSFNDADPKYRNCIDSQVIDSEPRAKHKVEPGTNVLLKCITQEVIDESQKLYEESEARKAEARIQRSEQIEQSKAKLVGVKDKVKGIPKLRKSKEAIVTDIADITDNN